MNKELAAVLSAREERWALRQSLSQIHQSSVLSMTLCVPLAYRTHPDFERLLEEMFQLLSKMLPVPPTHLHRLAGGDGYGRVACFAMDALELKKTCIVLEELPGGRLLDLDVTDSQGKSIGREEVKTPPRRCFVCEGDAAYCVVNKTHTKEDISQEIHRLFKLAQDTLEQHQQ